MRNRLVDRIDIEIRIRADGFFQRLAVLIERVDPKSRLARKFANNVKLCTLATSLGGVETILQHSASMTHATLSPAERQAAGITDGLIRLSVGVEDAKDLIEDITQALDKV